MRLTYLNEAGSLEEQDADYTATEIYIGVRKGFAMPILAEPVLQPSAAGTRLPPAGAIAPVDLNYDNCLVLSWERGFVCDILMQLAEIGIGIDSINIERLSHEIELRSDGDPFKIDRTRILESLSSGDFRVTDIRSLPESEVTINPGAGDWFSESPFSPLYRTDGVAPTTLNLTHGFHQLFSLSMDVRYDIQVSEKEVVYLRVPP